MASEISHRHSATGETLYATIRSTARQMWNTAGTPNFETLTVVNWTDYDIALSETPASSYFYVGTFPAISGNMVAGWYWVDVFEQAGASPAISDTLLASYFGYWDGTTFRFWADDTTHVNATLQTALDIGNANLGDTGISLAKALEMLAAFLAGEISRSSDAGVTTLSYYKRDGETVSFTSPCNEDDGDRATTGSLS